MSDKKLGCPFFGETLTHVWYTDEVSNKIAKEYKVKAYCYLVENKSNNEAAWLILDKNNKMLSDHYSRDGVWLKLKALSALKRRK